MSDCMDGVNSVSECVPVGRFAPSPSGRMHLGNIFAALMSWLSVKSRGGRWILRIEDLDSQRSRMEYARAIEDDLHWLGLEPDAGGLDALTPEGESYCQSRRHHLYAAALERLAGKGLLYGCRCRRADIMATQAPHQSDGRVVYAGTCRPCDRPPFAYPEGGFAAEHMATRIYVPDEEIRFSDRAYGVQSVNLAQHCGDFLLRRADGAWAYQLAVVVDDAAMGVTEVVRGSDLLLSAAQQIYLYRCLGLPAPEFSHIPLICNSAGQRLSKRDSSLAMDSLRERYTPQALVGYLASLAGIIPPGEECTPGELLPLCRQSSGQAAASSAIMLP